MITNTEICQKLRRLHTLLVLGKRSNNLALAIRRALEIIPTWQEEAETRVKKTPVRLLFAGYGPKFIKIFDELLQTGQIEMLNRLQPEFDTFFCYLCEIPGIGETMARRMYFERSIHTLDDLRIAYSNDILKKIPSFGETRLKAIEAILIDLPRIETEETIPSIPAVSTPDSPTCISVELPDLADNSNDLDIMDDSDENLSNEVAAYIDKPKPTPSPVIYNTPSDHTKIMASPDAQPTLVRLHQSPRIFDKSQTITDIPAAHIRQTATICSYIHDFSLLRKANGYYLDKSMLIADLIENHAILTQFQRPAGFGLTMAMSMIKAFFEQDFNPNQPAIDNAPLFNHLRIMQAGSHILSEMGKYPIIPLTLEQTDASHLKQIISEQYNDYQWILDSTELEEHEKNAYRHDMNDVSHIDISKAIRRLIQWIYRIARVQVICLIDLTPVDPFTVSDLDLSLLAPIWHNNPALKRCILFSHDILPIENAQTISVHTKTRDEYFGFTELEIRSLLSKYHMESSYEQIQQWYGMFDVSGRDIFMPKGVMQFIQSQQIPGKPVPNETYWSLTQEKPLAIPYRQSVYQDIHTLCHHPDQNYTISREIQSLTKANQGYTRLLRTGLIRATEQIPTQLGTLRCQLKIPNQYARYKWLQWLNNIRLQQISQNQVLLQSLKEALLLGPATAIEYELKRLFSILSVIYIPDTSYYKQAIAETCEMIGFISVDIHDNPSQPDIVLIDSETAIGLFMDVITENELKQNQLSSMTTPDPEITKTDIQKLSSLLNDTLSQIQSRLDTTVSDAQIQLKYPDITTIHYYGITICRNQCCACKF